jgi:hypothetical protein
MTGVTAATAIAPLRTAARARMKLATATQTSQRRCGRRAMAQTVRRSMSPRPHSSGEWKFGDFHSAMKLCCAELNWMWSGMR